MARADLLKILFRSYKTGDDLAFLEAAKHLIEDERKKNHVTLANELARIIEAKQTGHRTDLRPTLQSLPKDSDKGTPLLEIRQPSRHIEDLIISDEQADSLLHVVTEFRNWEILEANGVRAAHKLLFCGPPGCGKTATAEALSTALGIPLLYVRFDSVVSSLLGETAANLRKVFDYASRDVWVLFFDEFDAVGRSRDDATEHGELKRVVNSFLQILDQFSGRSLVIAATNFEQSLDPALWRRFDEIIRFEKPSEFQVRQLIDRLIGQRLETSEILNEARFLVGVSHAEIERICLDSLKSVILSGERTISLRTFREAVGRQNKRTQALQKSRSRPPQVNEE